MMYLGLQHFVFGMISAILFSMVACFLGIPTSESHGLIAGITGAAIAVGGFKFINLRRMGKCYIRINMVYYRYNFI